MARRVDKRGFGSIRKLASGRYQARYTGPTGERVTAPVTFSARIDAEARLIAERGHVEHIETWLPPEVRIETARRKADADRQPTFDEYAGRWIAERKVKGRPLAPRTRDHYQQLLDDYLSPAFGQLDLGQITPQAANRWYDAFQPRRVRSHGKETSGETARAHTYALARAIMNTAVSAHGPLVGAVNPFAVRGGGSAPSNKRTEVATGEQLKVILDTIRPEWRALVLLATWCGLRFSEAAELRRSDIDLDAGMVRIRRAVTRSRAEGVGVKAPKSDAGTRDLHIPSHVVPQIKGHLHTYVTGRDGLLFPGYNGHHLAPGTFTGGTTKYVKGKPVKRFNKGSWYAARDAAGCPALHFHDLRATGATLMAQLGATEAEIQAFLGDSTPQAAQRYVRAARSRMAMLADRMSDLAATGNW